jgi:hypothetical protein
MWFQPLETQVAKYNKRTKDLKNQTFYLQNMNLIMEALVLGQSGVNQ